MLRTSSNPADSNRLGSHTRKIIKLKGIFNKSQKGNFYVGYLQKLNEYWTLNCNGTQKYYEHSHSFIGLKTLGTFGNPDKLIQTRSIQIFQPINYSTEGLSYLLSLGMYINLSFIVLSLRFMINLDW